MPAPTDFTVAQIMAHSDEPWKGKEGPMMTYELRFEGDEQIFKMHVPAEDPAPVAGGVEKGWKNEGGKFGRARPKGAPSNRSSGGTAPRSDGPGLTWKSAPFEKGAEHPRNEKRAIHTSALSSAPAYYELLRTEGVWDQAQSDEDVFKRCRRLVAWLEKTYQLEEPPPQMEIPADTDGLGERSQVPADDVPFS